MLDINMEFKQGILLVRLKGLLNGDTVGILKKDLEMIIKDNGIKYVLINACATSPFPPDMFFTLSLSCFAV